MGGVIFEKGSGETEIRTRQTTKRGETLAEKRKEKGKDDRKRAQERPKNAAE